MTSVFITYLAAFSTTNVHYTSECSVSHINVYGHGQVSLLRYVRHRILRIIQNSWQPLRGLSHSVIIPQASWAHGAGMGKVCTSVLFIYTSMYIVLIPPVSFLQEKFLGRNVLFCSDELFHPILEVLQTGMKLLPLAPSNCCSGTSCAGQDVHMYISLQSTNLRGLILVGRLLKSDLHTSRNGS